MNYNSHYNLHTHTNLRRKKLSRRSKCTTKHPSALLCPDFTLDLSFLCSVCYYSCVTYIYNCTWSCIMSKIPYIVTGQLASVMPMVQMMTELIKQTYLSYLHLHKFELHMLNIISVFKWILLPKFVFSITIFHKVPWAGRNDWNYISDCSASLSFITVTSLVTWKT